MRPRLLAAFSLLSLIPAPACMYWDWDGGPTYASEQTVEFSVSAAEVQRLTGSTGNGSLDLVGNPDLDQIRVVVRKQALGLSQEEADANLARMQIVNEVVDGELQLGWEWSSPRSGNRSANVTFRIEAPADLPVQFTTHNGEMSVRDWAGTLRGESHNGSMDIQGAFGEVELITYNGNIEVRLGGSGELNGNIQTYNGEVEVEVGGDLSAMVVASTDNGSVRYSGRLDRVESGRNFLVGDIGDATGRLRISTHNGGVRIR